jgi:hypothetical protein
MEEQFLNQFMRLIYPINKLHLNKTTVGVLFGKNEMHSLEVLQDILFLYNLTLRLKDEIEYTNNAYEIGIMDQEPDIFFILGKYKVDNIARELLCKGINLEPIMKLLGVEEEFREFAGIGNMHISPTNYENVFKVK